VPAVRFAARVCKAGNYRLQERRDGTLLGGGLMGEGKDGELGAKGGKIGR